MNDQLFALSTAIIPMVLAITLHEAAHGLAADRLGDDTARRLGRISLNPLRHVDPVGTVILPGLLAISGAPVFGWAKPVPVVPRNLRHPKSGMAWVAAAGPATNFILALAALLLLALLLRSHPQPNRWLAETLLNGVTINLFLMALNMLPLPPLDGSKVLIGVLPMPLARPLAQFERHGMWLVIGLLVLLPALFGVNPIGDFLIGVVTKLIAFLAAPLGLNL
jgi:Zn-dependent protease